MHSICCIVKHQCHLLAEHLKVVVKFIDTNKYAFSFDKKKISRVSHFIENVITVLFPQLSLPGFTMIRWHFWVYGFWLAPHPEQKELTIGGPPVWGWIAHLETRHVNPEVSGSNSSSVNFVFSSKIEKRTKHIHSGPSPLSSQTTGVISQVPFSLFA